MSENFPITLPTEKHEVTTKVSCVPKEQFILFIMVNN